MSHDATSILYVFTSARDKVQIMVTGKTITFHSKKRFYRYDMDSYRYTVAYVGRELATTIDDHGAIINH
jgi:hypothetical protein